MAGPVSGHDGRFKDRAAYAALRGTIRIRDADNRLIRTRAAAPQETKATRRAALAAHKAPGARQAAPKTRRTRREKNRFVRTADLHRHVAVIHKDTQDKITTSALCASDALVGHLPCIQA